jgi:hypothetical protein
MSKSCSVANDARAPRFAHHRVQIARTCALNPLEKDHMP